MTASLRSWRWRRPPTHVAAVATAFSVAWAGSALAVPAQVDVASEVRVQVAAEWGIGAPSVRLELPADVPATVDSLRVDPGAGDRWITTFWVEGNTVRRFVRVGSVAQLPTAASELPRGHVVAAEDVVLTPGTIWGAPPKTGKVPEGEALSAGETAPVGWVVQRHMRAGEALAAPGVRPPLLVRGGDDVEAILRLEGVVLNIRAEALSSARSGDEVAVRMPSGRRMDGKVVGPGTVLLNSGVLR